MHEIHEKRKENENICLLRSVFVFILFIVNGNIVQHIEVLRSTYTSGYIFHNPADRRRMRNEKYSLDFPSTAVIWPPVLYQSARTIFVPATNKKFQKKIHEKMLATSI